MKGRQAADAASRGRTRSRGDSEDSNADLVAWQREAQHLRYDRPAFLVLRKLPAGNPSLDCGGIKLNDREAWLVSASLKNSVVERIHGTPLRELNLGGCGLNRVMAELLASALTQNSTLQRLVLRNNPLGPDGVKSVMSGLAAAPQWHVGQAIAERRAAAEAENEQARRGAKRGGQGLGTAPPGLRSRLAPPPSGFASPREQDRFCLLRELDLSATDMTAPPTSGVKWLASHGLRAVCDFLMRPECRLRSVRLCRNRVDEELFGMLELALQHNSTLCSVDLADCMLGTERGSAVLGLASAAVPRRLMSIADDARDTGRAFTPAHRRDSRAMALRSRGSSAAGMGGFAMLEDGEGFAGDGATDDGVGEEAEEGRARADGGEEGEEEATGAARQLSPGPPYASGGGRDGGSRRPQQRRQQHRQRGPGPGAGAAAAAAAAASHAGGPGAGQAGTAGPLLTRPVGGWTAAEAAEAARLRRRPETHGLDGSGAMGARDDHLDSDSPGRLTTRNASKFPWLVRQGPSSMETLCLRGCGLKDAGATAIRDALQRRCRLQQLDVSRNGISATGFRQIAMGLRTTFVKSVDVSHNTIGRAGASLLAQALASRLITVRALKVAFCGLTDGGKDPGGVLEIADALRENRTLVHLDMAGNSLVLQRQGYHPTAVSQSTVYRLAEALRGNRTLATLDLSKNWIGLPGQRALRDAIAAQPGAVPFGGFIAAALRNWSERMLWRRAEKRLGRGAPSGHPVLSDIYRGYEGGLRFENPSRLALGNAPSTRGSPAAEWRDAGWPRTPGAPASPSARPLLSLPGPQPGSPAAAGRNASLPPLSLPHGAGGAALLPLSDADEGTDRLALGRSRAQLAPMADRGSAAPVSGARTTGRSLGGKAIPLTVSVGVLDGIPAASDSPTARDADALLRRQAERTARSGAPRRSSATDGGATQSSGAPAELQIGASGLLDGSQLGSASLRSAPGMPPGMSGGSHVSVGDGSAGAGAGGRARGDDEDRDGGTGYGGATLSLAEALALAAAGPTQADLEAAAEAAARAAKQAAELRRRQAKLAEKQERQREAAERVKPLPPLPKLDFKRLRRPIQVPKRKVPPKPQARAGPAKAPPSKPLPSAAGAARSLSASVGGPGDRSKGSIHAAKSAGPTQGRNQHGLSGAASAGRGLAMPRSAASDGPAARLRDVTDLPATMDPAGPAEGRAAPAKGRRSASVGRPSPRREDSPPHPPDRAKHALVDRRAPARLSAPLSPAGTSQSSGLRELGALRSVGGGADGSGLAGGSIGPSDSLVSFTPQRRAGGRQRGPGSDITGDGGSTPADEMSTDGDGQDGDDGGTEFDSNFGDGSRGNSLGGHGRASATSGSAARQAVDGDGGEDEEGKEFGGGSDAAGLDRPMPVPHQHHQHQHQHQGEDGGDEHHGLGDEPPLDGGDLAAWFSDSNAPRPLDAKDQASLLQRRALAGGADSSVLSGSDYATSSGPHRPRPAGSDAGQASLLAPTPPIPAGVAGGASGAAGAAAAAGDRTAPGAGPGIPLGASASATGGPNASASWSRAHTASVGSAGASDVGAGSSIELQPKTAPRNRTTSTAPPKADPRTGTGPPDGDVDDDSVDSERSDWSAGGAWVDSERGFGEAPTERGADDGGEHDGDGFSARLDITQHRPPNAAGGPRAAARDRLGSRTEQLDLGRVGNQDPVPQPRAHQGPGMPAGSPASFFPPSAAAPARAGGIASSLTRRPATEAPRRKAFDWRDPAVKAEAAMRSAAAAAGGRRSVSPSRGRSSGSSGYEALALAPRRSEPDADDWFGDEPQHAGSAGMTQDTRLGVRAADMAAIAAVDPLRVSVVREAWDKTAPGTAIASQAWLVTRLTRAVFSFLEEPREVFFDDDRMRELGANLFATKRTAEPVRAVAAGGAGVERPSKTAGKTDLGQLKMQLDHVHAALHGGHKLPAASSRRRR
ncbi:hypothetical protein FNF31_02083 [Cafeteria roenbergensis]|uniref:Uncharacterized protein n=1 Tax=Cafeteria roenbergensis TaxID=33653 RepID=A0A5A8DM58_CAFRO|nr:hypothetical protein FNF31_02083 [Cafeteria roenbergensis]